MMRFLRVFWLLAGVCLSACQTAQAPSSQAVSEPAEMVEPQPEPRETRAERVQQWLERADQALSDDRLMSPLGNNAHDLYRAALLYDPDNSRAISGLQAIALRYLQLARSAAARSAYTQALGYLDLADSANPGNPLVAEFQENLRAQREHQAKAAALTEEGNIIRLNGELLRQRADSLVAELHTLARRVRESEEFVLIVSRTDAEGRWIYQQMRDGAPGHVLRGDIRLGSPPRIELQPPL